MNMISNPEVTTETIRTDVRIIIAGTRTFDNYSLLRKKTDAFIEKYYSNRDIIIVSGGASGADSLGEKYAKERGFKLKRFPANWSKYGKMAGMIRNRLMAEYSNALVAFWDNVSPGTKNMIKLARDHHLEIKIVIYEEGDW